MGGYTVAVLACMGGCKAGCTTAGVAKCMGGCVHGYSWFSHEPLQFGCLFGLVYVCMRGYLCGCSQLPLLYFVGLTSVEIPDRAHLIDNDRKVSNQVQTIYIYFDIGFIYLGFYVAFNTVQVISRRVVLWAEETSTYSWCQGSVL